MPDKYAKITNERQYLVSLFWDELKEGNIWRRKNKKTLLTRKIIAIRMSHIRPERELRHFYDDCTHAKDFGKYWGWALRV